MLNKDLEMEINTNRPEVAADEKLFTRQEELKATSDCDVTSQFSDESAHIAFNLSPSRSTSACSTKDVQPSLATSQPIPEAFRPANPSSSSSPFSFVVQQTREDTDKLSSTSDLWSPSLIRLTSDETTQRRIRKRRPADSLAHCICPVCGVTVRTHELQTHLQQEAKQLEKIPKQVARHIKDAQASASSHAKRSSPPLSGSGNSSSSSSTTSDNRTTPATRTKIFHKVKSNRNFRSSVRSGRQEYREAVCPVCHKQLQGTASELNRHAESCLRKRDAQSSSDDDDVDIIDTGEEENDEEHDEYQWGDETRVRVTSLLRGNFEACGYTTVKPSAEDDEDLNVDGDDSITYGQPQYTESDIIPCFTDSASKDDMALRRALTTRNEDMPVGQEEGTSTEHVQDVLKANNSAVTDPVTNGTEEVATEGIEDGRLDQVVEELGDAEAEASSATAQSHENDSHSSVRDGLLLTRPTDQRLLIAALHQQIAELRGNKSQSEHNVLKCLICMDPYNKPVVSVLCWHVYCEECWLRTLGAKKLCPQCNTITSASDLRKIYM